MGNNKKTKTDKNEVQQTNASNRNFVLAKAFQDISKTDILNSALQPTVNHTLVDKFDFIAKDSWLFPDSYTSFSNSQYHSSKSSFMDCFNELNYHLINNANRINNALAAKDLFEVAFLHGDCRAVHTYFEL